MSDSRAPVAVRMVLSGRVQGVGFRYFTRREAQRLGLVGWVKNLPGGEVEVRARGSAAALEAFRERLRRGPAGSLVERLEESELAAPADWKEFRITF